LKTGRLLGSVLLASSLSLFVPGPATASGRSRMQAVSLIDVRDGQRNASYWTAARMMTATPLDRRAELAGPPAEIPRAHPTAGSRVVGALFFDDGAGSHFCTASVIRTAKRNLLLTAAHCLFNPGTHQWHDHIVFVPKYGQGDRPYGTWPVWLMVVDQRWMSNGDPDLDFGFAAVQVIGGHRIADVVGSNQLLIDHDVSGSVFVIGYPSKANYPADRPIWCNTQIYRQDRHQMRFDCRGFFGGTSGSPLLKGYDRRTQTGYVMGVIGGYQQGGAYDWRSYSATFEDGIAHLIVTANNQA
jgi:V8-like Glu-specific endopeptidase